MLAADVPQIRCWSKVLLPSESSLHCWTASKTNRSMSELLDFLLNQVEQFRKLDFSRHNMNPTNGANRARLPSLYSDFTLQRHTNPDGYAANVAAWEKALLEAAKAGLVPAPNYLHDTLSIQISEDLLRSLETKDWGRPLALETVAVGERPLISLSLSLTSHLIHWIVGRSDKQTAYDFPPGVPRFSN